MENNDEELSPKKLPQSNEKNDIPHDLKIDSTSPINQN